MNYSKTFLVVGSNSQLSLRIIENLPSNNTFVLYNSIPKYKHENVLYFSISELNKLPKIDVVFIISAFIPDNINSFEDNQNLYNVNVDFIKKISSHFKDSKLIYASSVSVYDNFQGNIIKEDSTLNPTSPYAISKLWGETIIKQASKYSIIRISSLIGKGLKETTFVPMIISSALKSGTITLFGRGVREQNYINFTEAGKMFIKASELSANSTYLAVSNKSVSNKEIAESIKMILPKISIIYKGDDDSLSYKYDASKTYSSLNYTPSITIEESINEIIQWKKEQF